MRRANAISGASFRTALNAALMIAVLLGLTGFLLVSTVSNTLRASLKLQIDNERALLEDIYAAEGRSGLIMAVEGLSKHLPPSAHASGLFDGGGLKLAGTASLAPQFIGWREVSLRQLTVSEDDNHLMAVVRRMDELTLIVGRSMEGIQTARRRLVIGMLLVGLLLIPAILFVGYRASRKSLRKLEGMEETLRRIAAGDMSARLAHVADGEQIDRISGHMNRNLDRLSALMSTTRSTATAIAHDLKTPLSHIHLRLHEALDKAEAGDSSDAEIGEALAATGRLNEIIETMLRLSRISTGKVRLQNCDLTVLAEETVKFLDPLAQEQQQTLHNQMQPPVQLICDRGMVQQLLVNLVSNAIRYSGTGSTITIDGDIDDEAVILSVSDSGNGIPEAERSRVLEPFTRLDASRGGEGNGLGLALVAAIVGRHDAELTMSDLVSGFRVSVRFPITSHSIEKDMS